MHELGEHGQGGHPPWRRTFLPELPVVAIRSRQTRPRRPAGQVAGPSGLARPARRRWTRRSGPRGPWFSPDSVLEVCEWRSTDLGQGGDASASSSSYTPRPGRLIKPLIACRRHWRRGADVPLRNRAGLQHRRTMSRTGAALLPRPGRRVRYGGAQATSVRAVHPVRNRRPGICRVCACREMRLCRLLCAGGSVMEPSGTLIRRQTATTA